METQCENIQFERGQWKIQTHKTHISDKDEITKIEDEIGFEPPEMIFGSNFLSITHIPTGTSLTYNARDALKHVLSADASPVTVASANEWNLGRDRQLEARVGATIVEKPYDWTFTTTYKGSLQEAETTENSGPGFRVERTRQSIDYEALKDTSASILAYDHVHLFETELDDNGTSQLSVRVRCMPDRAYILARFWLRVDNVLLRSYETRIECLYDRPFLLREYSQRESSSWNWVKRLRLDNAAIDPNVESRKLPLQKPPETEKLEISAT